MKNLEAKQMEALQGGLVICEPMPVPDVANAPFFCIPKHVVCPPGFICIL